MTKSSGFSLVPIRWKVLFLHIFIGSNVALSAICLLLLGVENPKPEWGEFWMIKPLLMVSAAGGMGGFCVYFIRQALNIGTMARMLAILLSSFAYIISLWLGTVLGLNGTLWD